MKKTFHVPLHYVFKGRFKIKAESKEEAQRIALEDCGLVLGGDIHTTDDDAVIDWHYNTHPEKVIPDDK